jgi:hypothetical protein
MALPIKPDTPAIFKQSARPSILCPKASQKFNMG